MDLIIENVGRRSSSWGEEGDPTDVGQASLNGRERNALYWNQGDGNFEEVGHLAHAGRSEDGRGVAVADFDRDGRLDLAILIHATPETRFARRLARDQAERSLTPDIIRYQWERHVRPGDVRFLEPVSHLADVVVDNDRAGEPDLGHALAAIDERIKS